MIVSKEKTIADVLSCILGDSFADKAIPVGVSNRHIHLSRSDMDVLFGAGHALTELRPLSQPGQFAAQETLCISGPKGSIANVRVLGPLRKESQVEISRSDAFLLGVKPPVRVSGDLAEAADICVIGPAGMLVMPGKVIIARRHIHMTQSNALHFGVSDGDMVTVEAGSEKRCRFEGVIVRVAETFALEFHIDIDEANAADLGSGMTARLV